MKKHLLVLLIPLIGLYADVTKETYMSMKMSAGMMDMQQTTKSEIRPTMKMDDNTSKMNVTFIQGKPAHKGEITRVDKGIMWAIDHDAKTYRETEIKLPENRTDVKTEVRGSGAPDTSYRVVKSEFTVTKLDSTRTINGFTCTGYIAKWTLVVEKVATRKQDTSIMTTRLWNTPVTSDIKQAQTEEEAYGKAYLAKLNLNVTPEQGQMLGMQYMMTLGMSPATVSTEMQKATTELAKIEGYSIVTRITWEVPVPPTATKEAEKPPAPSLGNIPSLGGILSREIDKKLAPKAADQGIVFDSYLEIKSLKVGSVPDKDFEVPEGYKKLTN